MKTDRLVRSRWAAIGAAVAVTLGAGGVFAANALPAGTPASFEPLSPTRILNTRNGTGAPAQKLGAGKEITLQVTGVGGVPADATSVVLNMTATNASQDSFITVYPFGETRPDASVLNFKAGEDVPNMITVKLGTDGKIVIYNDRGSVDVLADTAGYFHQKADPAVRWGRFDAAGTLQAGNFGINMPRIGTGFYQSTSGVNFLECSYSVSILGDNVTTAREIVVDRGAFPTDVRVRIFTSGGVPVDSPFTLVSYCPS